jgi:predicted lipid-binding transport protein (Tim44 family)
MEALQAFFAMLMIYGIVYLILMVFTIRRESHADQPAIESSAEASVSSSPSSSVMTAKTKREILTTARANTEDTQVEFGARTPKATESARLFAKMWESARPGEYQCSWNDAPVVLPYPHSSSRAPQQEKPND